MVAFAATILAIFPRVHLGEREIQGCMKICPCLGEGAPVLRWLKNAFSAPRICIVPAGSRASLALPCASVHNLAAKIGPNKRDSDGRCDEASSLTTSYIAFSRFLISQTLTAQSCKLSHSASVGPTGGIPT